jgi:hypothetical protein
MLQIGLLGQGRRSPVAFPPEGSDMGGDVVTRDKAYANNEPIIHARRAAMVPAPCGAKPGSPWTLTRGYVTCSRCLQEIARRLGPAAAHAL